LYKVCGSQAKLARLAKQVIVSIEYMYYKYMGDRLGWASSSKSISKKQSGRTAKTGGIMMENIETYTSIAQRVAASYLRFLTPSAVLFPERSDGNLPPGLASQRDLHDFFQAFYHALFAHPEQFGLPLVEDDAYVEGEANGTAHKAELNRKLKRPRDLIHAGLGFLLEAGNAGLIQGEALQVPAATATQLKKNRGLRTFLQGLRAAGLVLVEENGTTTLRNPSFPEMMPAFQALAQSCSANPKADLGLFHFSRCDLRALLPRYTIDVMDLYQALPPAASQYMATLHAYFLQKKYQPILAISGVSAWMVQYQGKRQIKSTPIFQVEYQERYRHPVTLFIKPASTSRIAPLIERHSPALQDDFFRRANYCRGDECGWCRNNKTLGPTAMQRHGEPVVVCWYTNPVVTPNEQCVALIKEYVELHEELVN
jgi:hypothetical protein